MSERQLALWDPVGQVAPGVRSLLLLVQPGAPSQAVARAQEG